MSETTTQEAIRHLAGPLKERVQKCARCGCVVLKHCDSKGFPEGFDVIQHSGGQWTAAGHDPDAPPGSVMSWTRSWAEKKVGETAVLCTAKDAS